MLIESKQNKYIKLLKKLSQKKYRYQENKFAVENFTIIYDAIRSGYDFEDIFVTEDFVNKNEKKFKYLIENSKIKNYYLITNSLNKYYSSLDTISGITAIYNINSSDLDLSKSVVYLNGISNPGNLGTIMRTMIAFGFVNLVVDNKCADIYNTKTTNASKDAIFKLNIFKDQDNKWLEKNKKDIAIYTTSSLDGVNLDKFKPVKKFCLVLGSETHGISEDIMNMADKNIKIKISEDIESLNVAIATGILLYRLR